MLTADYKLLKKKGEGTFSKVFEAQHTKTGKRVAIKCMRKKYDTLSQVNKLREIQALKMIYPHDCVIQLIEIL